MCYGADAPWSSLVSESEFNERVVLTEDTCVVDGRHFLKRGHEEIPVLDGDGFFAWSVWCSLSEDSFRHALKRWRAEGRENDAPYFGWLMTSLSAVYPETLNLKANVQSRQAGLVPLVILEPTDHLLSREQHEGITMARVREIAHKMLHAGDS
jgi:hypothetical protein